MFKKNKSQEKKLLKQYDKLMKEGYKLSTINRKQSDEKYARANEILTEIEKIRAQEA
ncbi:MAG: Lacal_2735 family protein [Bacteroidales bacterium]|nr:Lacal_2735 family protein [Bacteroidales bacterium]